MNGKNIYTGNINSSTRFVPNQGTVANKNQKYVATIVSENLKKNSIDKDYDYERAVHERKLAKAKQRAAKENTDKVSATSDEMLKMSVNWDDYDFNEWNRKIVDAYNPYAIDDLSNTALTNYEKIKRILANEIRDEQNFEKFNENLDLIYDDIKEKITNETLKIIYGEDNFEYVPNKLETYKKDWSTGDEEADLLLKLYHSPKIRQRDISANEYIARKFASFAAEMNGSQSFEVQSAKTGVNPNDIVRVNLEKAYYMDDTSLESNRNTQLDFIRTIQEKQTNIGNKPGQINRFGSRPQPGTKPSAPVPPRPAPQVPMGETSTLSNDATSNNNIVTNEKFVRTVPRREEWVSKDTNQQLLDKTKDIENWEKIEEFKNVKLEEFIIENGLVIKNVTHNPETNNNLIVLQTIIFDDEDRELEKIESIKKFAKKNKYLVNIENNDETKEQIIIFEFKKIEKVDASSLIEQINKENEQNIELMNEGNEFFDDKNNDINNVGETITNIEELTTAVENKEKNIERVKSSDLGFVKFNQYNTPSKTTPRFNKPKDNITGVGGMVRMGSDSKTTSIKKNNKKSVSNLEVIYSDKPRSLAEVLAEKRNKNHKQMQAMRLNEKHSLKEAIDELNSNIPDRGPRKPRKQ